MTILFIDDDRTKYLSDYVNEFCIKNKFDIDDYDFIFIDKLCKLRTLDVNNVMLAFLDIDLNDKYNGIDVAKMLVSINKLIKIVFVSAFAEKYSNEINSFKEFASNSYLATISKNNRIMVLNNIISYIDKQSKLAKQSKCVIYLDEKINEHLIVNNKYKGVYDDINAYKFNSLNVTINNKKIVIKDKPIERTIRLVLFIMNISSTQCGDELKETVSKYLDYLVLENDQSGISDVIDSNHIELKLSHLRHLVSRCNLYFKDNYDIDNIIVGAGKVFTGNRVEYSRLYKFNSDFVYLPSYDEKDLFLDNDLNKILSLFKYCYKEGA